MNLRRRVERWDGRTIRPAAGRLPQIDGRCKTGLVKKPHAEREASCHPLVNRTSTDSFAWSRRPRLVS